MEINSILDSEATRKSFLMGLVFIAKADGVVEPEELVFFQNAALAMGLSESSLQEINDCWQLTDCPPLAFTNSTQQKFFLREAIQLSYIDNNYAKEEQALIRVFASNFGISLGTVNLLEQWVEEGMKWKSEGDKLILSEE